MIWKRGRPSLEEIAEWIKEGGLELAPGKSEVIFLIDRKRLSRINLYLVREEIKTVTYARYLRVYLDRGLRSPNPVSIEIAEAVKAANSIANVYVPKKRGADA